MGSMGPAREGASSEGSSETGTGYRPERPLLLGAILLATIAVYAPTLGHPFQYDDLAKLVNNPKLQQPLAYVEAFEREGYSEDTTRFFPNLTFCLDFALFGRDSFGYHLTNLLLHLINVWLVALLGQTALRRLGRRDQVTPLLGAALFALHPLNSEAVNYCNARPNLMVTTFYLLSLISFTRSLSSVGQARSVRLRRWGGFVAALGAALLSKELAITILLMVPLFPIWIQGTNSELDAGQRKRLKAVAVGLAAVGLVTLAATGAGAEVYRLLFRSGGDFGGGWLPPVLLDLLGQARVMMSYLGLALLPLPSFLNVNHDFPSLREALVAAGSDPGSSMSLLMAPLASAIVLTAAVVAAFAFRRSAVLATFLGLWPLITHLPTSALPRNEVMVEYRTYLPMVGVCLLLAWAMRGVFDAAAARWRHARLRPFAVALALALLASLSVGTAVRNRVWRSPLALWQDAVEKAPDCPRALNNLGNALIDGGRLSEAERVYRRALAVDADDPELHSNLGRALFLQGRAKDAVVHYTRALTLNPSLAETHYNLGIALTQAGLKKEAIDHYRLAVRTEPGYANAHNNLGAALAAQGRLDEAMHHYRRALAADPDHAEAHNNLGLALMSRNRLYEASAHFEQALLLSPDYAEAHTNLGVACVRLKKLGLAVKHLLQATRIKPRLLPARVNLSIALAMQGKREQALEQSRRALSIAPDNARARWVHQKLTGETAVADPGSGADPPAGDP